MNLRFVEFIQKSKSMTDTYVRREFIQKSKSMTDTYVRRVQLVRGHMTPSHSPGAFHKTDRRVRHGLENPD